MPDDVVVFPLGGATVTVINAGDLRAPLEDWFPVAEHERPARYSALFQQPQSVPVNCIHIRLPNSLSILVDASRFEPADAVPGYQPTADLLEMLSREGIPRERVAHVIITHSHGDHFSALAHPSTEDLSFSQARHYLGRADWEEQSLQDDLRDPTSLVSRTLGLASQGGVLELVQGDHDLAPEVRIIAAPGESPGHQIVRVHSEGQTLYCVGDLYHHVMEVEQPGLVVHWAESATTLAARQALAAAALAENAYLVATHIPGIGRLRRVASGVEWDTVIPPA